MSFRTLLLGAAGVALAALLLWRVSQVPSAEDRAIVEDIGGLEPPPSASPGRGLVAFAEPVPSSDGTTRGRLIDAVTGSPIAAGLLEVGETEVRTENDGTFILVTPPPFKIRAVRAEGYTAFEGAERSWVAVHDPVHALVLRLAPAMTLKVQYKDSRIYRGLLRGADGASVRDGRVEVESVAEPETVLAAVDADDAGRYRVQVPASGEYRLVAIRGHAVLPVPAQDNAVLSFGKPSPLRVRVEGRGRSRLLYVSLTWLGQKTRRLLSERLVVGAASDFLFPDTGPGRYRVEVIQSDGAAIQRDVDIEDETSMVLQLDPGALLTGRVISETDAPVNGAEIRLRRVGARRRALEPPPPTAYSDANGAFSLRSVPAGAWSFAVRATGFAPRFTEPLESRGAGEMVPLMVQLSPRVGGPAAPDDEGGIGVEFRSRVYELLVVSVLPGGGARDAGLRPGDRVVRVEGQPISEIGYARTLDRLRGAAGTTIELEVRPAGARDTQLIRVERRAGVSDRIR
ncbi:MAG: carboxypeptidase regulatory-like domain-containing protein [Myxococcota bacterium]